MRNAGWVTVSLVFALLPAFAIGQDRPDFSGSWQFDASKSELHNIKLADATWTIEASENSIHLTESEGGKSKPVEFKCTTDGKDCASSAKAKASFWYNGAMLVEMETKGDHVTRYRLTLSQDGKTLKVETTYIVPKTDGNDVLVFNRKS
jgi:hypothetical protein